MTDFERIYIDGKPSEKDEPREKHLTHERSDKEYTADFVYKPPIPEEMSPELKKKYELSKKITEQTITVKIGNVREVEENFVTNLKVNHESNPSKSPKKKPKKLHKGTKQTTVARLQKKL